MVKEQSSSFSDMPSPAWQREFDASLKESDPDKLLKHIHSTEAAIGSRLRELAQELDKYPSREQAQQAERHAMDQALETLRGLKRDRLGFPDWNGNG